MKMMNLWKPFIYIMKSQYEFRTPRYLSRYVLLTFKIFRVIYWKWLSELYHCVNLQEA